MKKIASRARTETDDMIYEFLYRDSVMIDLAVRFSRKGKEKIPSFLFKEFAFADLVKDRTLKDRIYRVFITET
jgi:hypothetical protein